MGYKLCMAEKPSVAKDIAQVIGATKRCTGYYEGNGYRVTWAVGHLVGLAEPEEYGYVSKEDMWKDGKEKAYDQLPIIPKKFKLIVLESTKSQFEIIKNLIHDPEVDEIINCGDMGAEGHILQWFIREKAGCKKKVRRFCATSMTEEAIKKAMSNLRREEEFENIIKGEYCKKKADWIMGMSMSRVETLKYQTNITVGRVQSPTLYFVVKRYLDVKNFKVTNYYGINVELKDGFHISWNKDKDNIFDMKDKDSENRVLNKQVIELKCTEINKSGKGEIIDVIKEKRATDRPQLFDITELQREANKRYGYTAAQTLATAQSLYETQKILSYPRTDSRYITSDLEPYMFDRIRDISSLEAYKESCNKLLSEGLNIDKKIVDDKKVTDHHALIVTEKIKNFDIDKMQPTKEEKKKGVTQESLINIIRLIISRMIISFSKKFVYEQTSVKIQFPNSMIFTATGKSTIQEGWKKEEAYYLLGEEKGKEQDGEEQALPLLQKGQTVYVSKCFCIAKKTTSPKLHTEGTLLTAMENAGATIENGAILKGRGIGTQATRAEIIKKLFDSGYVENLKKGKTNYIMPTEKGISIIKVLPKELYSPKITADWEEKITKIVDGKMTELEFMAEFEEFIKEKVQEVKDRNIEVSFNKKEGKCPWCNGDIYKYSKKDVKGKIEDTLFYCSSKQCHFRLSENDPIVKLWTGKKLKEEQIQELIKNGEVILDCKKNVGKGKYKKKFVIIKKEVDGKVYTNLKCIPIF